LPWINGDRTVLTQLYQNLIGNALKFVSARMPIIELTAEQAGENWILGVRDNGIGMKQEYADRIFKPFQRLHSRGEYEGTGIGLAICKKSISCHGGSIWVESEPGVGCHFKFILKRESELEPCQISKTKQLKELSSC
jgi:light-regulated signal transduction histidine kinase (bacteriophytochrome)